MKNELKGFEKIFAFTFRHQAGKKSFRTVTVSVAILCILIPSLIMTGIEFFGGNDSFSESAQEEAVQGEMQSNAQSEAQNDGQEEAQDDESVEALDVSALKRIFVADISKGEKGLGDGKFSVSDFRKADYGAMAQYTGIDLSGVEFIDCGKDLEKALQEARGSDDALILAVNLQGSEYAVNLLIPQESTLDENIAYGVSPVFDTYVQTQIAELNGPQDTSDTEEEGTEQDMVKDVLGAVLPYVNIMLIYFFVLLYGAGVSQSVVMEKSSKLMDVFLISVKPSAMILGKMTAICLAGVLQIFIWVASLIAGFAIGYFGVKAINPETDMIAVQLLSDFGKLTGGMFSASGFIFALLIILAGMLLYCALAGIGGALAGKQEDLSSTNMLFTLILVASFFACLYGGGITDGEPSQWLFWVPFTSIMVTPSAVLLGTISSAQAFGAFAVILVTALLFTLLAGKLYKTMALYKGDVPGPKQLLKMIK